MTALTPRQLDTLQFIRRFRDAHGYSPTLSEMADELGVTKSTVQQYVQALEEKGAISREKYCHRSIEINDAPGGPDTPTELPLRGRITAGGPLEVDEVPDTVDVSSLLGLNEEKELFVLEVDGTSMIEEGIFDGDYVVVEKANTAEQGETVVALLPNNEVTLKKFYREKDGVRLQPANPDMEPIYVRDVTIQGIVRGVIRNCR